MATTADDWTWIKSLIAITDEGNIAIDLVAQAIDNLKVVVSSMPTTDVDIVGQTGGNINTDIKNSVQLAVDLVAQTVGALNVAISSIPTTNVDITGQTGGNLDIDIKNSIQIATDIVAQTIGNLAVDIKAATIGNIPMNINEQGVGDILINLNAQNIDRMIIRDHDGGIESSSSVQKNCPKGAETLIHGVSDRKGTLRGFFINVAAQDGAQYLAPRIYIDNHMMYPALNFNEWSTWGANQSSRPFQLLAHTVDGSCAGQYWFDKGIVFDNSLSLRIRNHSAQDDVQVSCFWFYQLIPEE